MKILILYRHFWPDSPPYAAMLRSIGRRLVAEGHEVTVWCEKPCYKLGDFALDAPARETLDGIRVERMGRLPFSRRSDLVRLAGKLAFVPRLIGKALLRRLGGERYDLVWTATIPPVMQGWAGRVVAQLFGARLLYHCQDLYPELANFMGMWPERGLASRLLAPIERNTRNRAAALVTLSDDMAQTARGLAPGAKVEIVNNFMLEDFDGSGETAPAPVERAAGAPIRIGFAGNIGQFQALDKVVGAMELVGSDAGIEFELMGDGKAKPSLRAQAHGMERVRFLDHRPFAEAQQAIARYDLGLISVEPDIYRVAYPSKTLTYLGLGVPLLAIIEPESELARMIVREDIGFVVGERDSKAIAARLAEAVAARDRLPAMREQARKYYDTVMSTQARLDQWAALLARLEEAR
ncbi:glycosyltransferase family 4 protein [Tsuneonella mangrovi]|uniref:glycosyltransferase family 4 protein n=1 Tax=Tsuneonella mangrovi TaxID=1982042 RepID=UPI000BA21FB4|nr:glycosyltransferase family 4 protein [Tsuneonella mangrovi]